MDAYNFICDRKSPPFVYASLPQISDLCCAMCEIDFVEVRDLTKSNFHWQIMKCRLLIHLISDIIAAPVSGTEKYLFIIIHKKFYESGKLEKILRNFKLVYQGLRTVTPELYKSCLKYAIQSKISPLWNKVGDYYIRGKEFYNAMGGSEAVTLDIIMNENNMGLQFHAEKIKVPCIKLEDYLPSSVISQFLADPKGYIDLSRYNFPFVYVLPSTKKGKLLSVSKEIPASSAFKDYNQIRRHWKNMYGYSLPKNSDNTLYYEIKFLVPKSKIFTYPNKCISSGPLESMTNKDKESTITHFLSDILIKLPTICGKQLQISKNDPFREKCSSANSLYDALSKDKELNIHLKEIDKNNSQLEQYTKFIDKVSRNVNFASKSSKICLAKIHEIHSVPLLVNTVTDCDDKSTRQNQNDTLHLNYTQSADSGYNDSVLEEKCFTQNSNDNLVITKEGLISNYFTNQKPNSQVNKGEERNRSMKNKLTAAKSNRNSELTLQEMEQSICVEAMAKNNQLGEVKNSVLSDWLKKHSIPHNSRGKKIDLINKVLSHLRNTQMLQQFRM